MTYFQGRTGQRGHTGMPGLPVSVHTQKLRLVSIFVSNVDDVSVDGVYCRVYLAHLDLLELKESLVHRFPFYILIP